MGRYHFIGWQGVIVAILVSMGVLLGPAYCQVPGVMLLLQQSPAQGGTIIPNAGVYDYAPNAQVTITAVAKPGYHFVYWLGDVTDPTSSTTVALLDKPKIIIAVFQQNEYDVLATGASGGGMHTSSAGGSTSFSQSTSGGGSTPTPPDNPKETEPEPPPVPPGPPEPPIPPEPPTPPVPEPATVVLLSLGGLALLKRRSA